MDFFEFLIALVTIGGTFITIWIVILYRRREGKSRDLSSGAAEDAYDLEELSAMARQMNERIDTLEAILDAEVPGWRDQHERHD